MLESARIRHGVQMDKKRRKEHGVAQAVAVAVVVAAMELTYCVSNNNNRTGYLSLSGLRRLSQHLMQPMHTGGTCWKRQAAAKRLCLHMHTCMCACICSAKKDIYRH